MNSIFPNWRQIRKQPEFVCDEYRDYLRTYKCLVCSRIADDPHHTVWKGHGGSWASDLLCVPLCREHHTRLHSSEFGSNESFEKFFVVHFEGAILQILQAWFRAKGWQWQEWSSLLELEQAVSCSLNC